MSKNILGFICCPKCKSNPVLRKNNLYCRNCRKNYTILEENIIDMLHDGMTEDLRLSRKKWDELYKAELRNETYRKKKEEYTSKYLKDTLAQIFKHYKFQRGDTYLEIGCGPMFLGQELAKKGLNVIGIDFSLPALKIAKRMFKQGGIKNYLLILGDLNEMPIADGRIDLIYGGGVIEHFRNTERSIKEMYRVLKTGGVCFNTVPELNLGALTYRQSRGSIPDFPILKQMAEFLHIKLLRSRHMKFGYQLSFTKKRIKSLFKEAGFNQITVRNFKCYLPFECLRLLFLKKLARRMAKLEFFNPMMFIAAQK